MAGEVKYKWNADENEEGASTPENGYANADVADKLGGEQEQPNPSEQEQEQPKPDEQEQPKPDEQEQPKPKEQEEGKPKEQEEEEEQPKPSEQEQEKELEDNELLALLKKKGFKGDSLEDLTQPKKEEEPKRPKAKDEDTEKFLEYQEKTGRGLKDWQALNEDLTKIDPLQHAKDRIRRENSGIDLSNEDVNYLLEDELGFDPTDSDLEPREKVLFKKFYGQQIQHRQTEQQKYNEPVDGFKPNQEQEQSQPNGEKVTLSSGAEVDLATYEEDRQQYLEAREAALADLGEEEFKVSFTGKDGKEELNYSYKYQDDDRHSMLSTTEDVGSILQNYQTEAGEFNHKSFNKDLWWTRPENRSKAISAIAAKVRADVIAEHVGERRNLNFNQPQQPSKPKSTGYANVGENKPEDAYGVKYPFPNKA